LIKIEAPRARNCFAAANTGSRMLGMGSEMPDRFASSLPERCHRVLAFQNQPFATDRSRPLADLRQPHFKAAKLTVIRRTGSSDVLRRDRVYVQFVVS
jgi:hypothetical protein